VAHILRLLLEQQAVAVVVGRILAEEEQVHKDLQVVMEMTVLAVLRLAVAAAWEV
jgi:hypothetical protein